MLDLVVFDLETTGLSAGQDEIIEIGAVRIQYGEVKDSFHALIRPTRDIPQEVTSLTGISMSDVADADSIETVIPKFLQFINHSTLCGHNVEFDVRFLQAAVEDAGYALPSSADTLDTLSLARILLPTVKSYALSDLAVYFGIEVERAHRAYDDVLTTLSLLECLSKRALTLPNITLGQLSRLAALYSPASGMWFQELADDRYTDFGTTLPAHCQVTDQLVYTTPDFSPVQEEPAEAAGEFKSTDLDEVSAGLLDSNSPLRKWMPGFEVRTGQKQMVSAVASALQYDQHLMVEAGTGTGKSLAYLIPSAIYAVQNDTRVVVSTHTISLQDQIQDRDFPTLRKVIPAPISLCIFKGRTHYICMRKLVQETKGLGFASPKEEIENYMGLLVWLTETEEGNREELNLRSVGSDIWPRVQSETETCINKRCPFFKPCYYFRARAKAYEADVIVTNHSLIFSDLKADHRVLPKYDKLILDEAHHLENEATKHLGEEVHLYRVMALIGRLVRDHGKHGVIPELISKIQSVDSAAAICLPALEKMSDRLLTLRSHVEDGFKTLMRFIPSGQADFRIDRNIEHTEPWRQFLAQVDDMVGEFAEISELRSSVEDAAERESDSDLSGRMFDATGFLNELEGQISILNHASTFMEDWVVWVEQSWHGERKQVSLYRAPIDVARILETTLFDKKSTVVLTSATLSVDGKFDFAKYRVGLGAADRDGRLRTLGVMSPFDFQKQSLLCIPDDIPDLSKMSPTEAATWLSDSIYQLAKTSKGRLLALFTSHAMLKATASAVRDSLRSKGLELYAQGIDGSRGRILEAFKRNSQSVLFGAQSFWEGIDLPGDQLTTLVIVRLPFAPPTHPVTEARHQRLEREGKSSFWAASLPEAVVRFRQGYGRLIRTVNDRGVVVVYDKRIVSTKYGQTFIKSLPGVTPFVSNESNVIAKVDEFLNSRKHN